MSQPINQPSANLATLPAIREIMDRSAKIAEICQHNQVARLELFGSAVTTAFDPATSDLDFLVEFSTDIPEGASERFFGLKQGLSEILGRSIDLIEVNTIQNPYFLRAISNNRLTIYGNRNPEVSV
ncbi:MAG: nucleotidyltransferase family protein [Spirulina sp.]